MIQRTRSEIGYGNVIVSSVKCHGGRPRFSRSFRLLQLPTDSMHRVFLVERDLFICLNALLETRSCQDKINETYYWEKSGRSIISTGSQT